MVRGGAAQISARRCSDCGRPAIDLESILLLIVAERRARQHAGVAVDLVVIKAPRGEDLLHAVEIGSRATSACPTSAHFVS